MAEKSTKSGSSTKPVDVGGFETLKDHVVKGPIEGITEKKGGIIIDNTPEEETGKGKVIVEKAGSPVLGEGGGVLDEPNLSREQEEEIIARESGFEVSGSGDGDFGDPQDPEFQP